MLGNRIRLFVVAAIVLSLLSFPAAAAAQAGGSWESGEFGYAVDFERDWEIDEDNTGVDEGVDVLQLLNRDDGLVLQIMFIPFGEISDLTEALDFYVGGVLEDPTAVEIDASGRGDDPWWLGEIEVEGQLVQVYVEGRELDDAMLLVVVLALDGDAAGAIQIAADTVTLDGDDLFETYGIGGDGPANGNDEPASGGGATEDGEYVAWTHPIVHLSFDPAVWVVKDDLSAEETDALRDVLILVYDDPDIVAAIYIETYDDYDGDPVDCLEAALEEGVGDSTTRGLDDENDDPIEGEEDDRAWSAVSYRNADGDRLATYVDCRVLPDGEGVVVVSLFTARSDFDDLYPEALDIVDSIEFVENDPGTDEPAVGGDGVVENDLAGFSVEYDTDLLPNADLTDTDDTVLSSADGSLAVLVMGTEADRNEEPLDCVVTMASQFGEATPIEDDNGDPIAGFDETSGFALFVVVDDDGAENALIVSCQLNPDGTAFAVLVGIAPIDDVDDLSAVVIEIMNSLTFD